MERDFKRPKVGDQFHINKRYDKGGWPVIRVLKVRTTSMLVQDCFADGTTGSHERPPRDFRDERGWPKLRKCWRRHRIPPMNSGSTSTPQRDSAQLG